MDDPGTWLADPEPEGLCDCTVYPAPTGTTSINGTADTALYAKLPYATPLVCAFPNLPSGTYTIELLFAETYRGNAPCVGGVGDRQLTITMEGTVVNAAYDLGRPAAAAPWSPTASTAAAKSPTRPTLASRSSTARSIS